MFHNRFSGKKQEFSIAYDEERASRKIAYKLLEYMPFQKERPIIFICVGTDRSTGDALGPLVGSYLLKQQLPENFHIFGTLKHPIHALNLKDSLTTIKQSFPTGFYIAIDACLGQSKHVGHIQINPGPLKPGAGVNKNLPEVGHIHITGIVNIAGFMEFFVLQNTRLHLVAELAQVIAEGIYHTGIIYQIGKNPSNKNNFYEEKNL